MESREKIKAHLLSVWYQEKKMFSRGRECMFFLTDKHVILIKKTEAPMKWWKAAVQRQTLMLTKSLNPMLIHDGYDEQSLKEDLQNEKNEEFAISDILSAESEEKAWGSLLKLKIRQGEKEKNCHFSIVKDWVGYPIRDPMKYLKVDWGPIIKHIQENRVAS